MTNVPELNLPIPATFERNLSAEFFASLDRDPTLSEEFLFHRIQLSGHMVDFVNQSPVYAHLERKIREMFLEGNTALLSANPTDHATIANAQVQVLAATKLMSIISEAIEDGVAAKQERVTRNQNV